MKWDVFTIEGKNVIKGEAHGILQIDPYMIAPSMDYYSDKK